MCSIGGFIAKDFVSATTARQLCQALLFYGRDRGQQSGGVYYNGRLVKAATDPYELSESEAFEELFKEGGKVALTHTRTPTSGGRGNAQAQPFIAEGVVTVHNGHIWASDKLKEQWKINKPSGVDSEMATSVISEHGIDALPKFIDDVSNTSAIAALVKNDTELYLLRYGNPIYVFPLKLDNGNKILIFGSTYSQVMCASRRVWLLDEGWARECKPLDDEQMYRAHPGGVQKSGPALKRGYRVLNGTGTKTWDTHGYKPHGYYSRGYTGEQYGLDGLDYTHSLEGHGAKDDDMLLVEFVTKHGSSIEDLSQLTTADKLKAMGMIKCADDIWRDKDDIEGIRKANDEAAKDAAKSGATG